MLSHTGQYALRAVVCIAEAHRDSYLTAGEIAGRTGVPADYLAKILHELAGAGLLDSSRGPRGGFRLTRPPDRLTIADVLLPFGRVAAGPCLLARPSCDRRHACPARRRCRALSTAVERFMRTTYIADLVWR